MCPLWSMRNNTLTAMFLPFGFGGSEGTGTGDRPPSEACALKRGYALRR